MQLDQILIRPASNQLIIQFSDSAGRADNLTIGIENNSNVAAIVADARNRLPAEADNPAKEEIEQEIAELEYRLRMLKQSIGEA